MSWIGIDPGMSGCLAVLGPGDRVRFVSTPTLPTGKGNRRRYDVPGLVELVRRASEGAAFLAIERQQSFPGQGVASSFSTGYGYGLWLAAITAARVPFETVAPATWKAALKIKALPGGGGSAASRKKAAKALAIETAQRLYPNANLLPTERSRTPSADLAEALLLAHYAKHRDTGAPL